MHHGRVVRFWSKVAACPHAMASQYVWYEEACRVCCWLWQGSLNEQGYGRTRYVFGDRDEVYAHRNIGGISRSVMLRWLIERGLEHVGNGSESTEGRDNT